MRREIIREVFLKEVRETLRDRRSLAVMFGVPLLLYPFLTMSLAGLGVSTMRRMARQASAVAVVHPAAAPRLVALLRRPGSGLRVLAMRSPRAALLDGRLDAVLIVPPGCERNALAARDARIRVLLDRSRTTSSFAQRKVDRLLDDYEKWILEQRLRARGVPVALLRPLGAVTEDVATGDRQLGSRLALMLPMMLLITGMLGAFFPAVNATTAERELGTLETLLVTPASKMELLIAKGALVLISSLLTAGMNMLSMALVLWRVFSQAARVPTAVAIDPEALALAYLAAVPTLVFFAGVVMIVGLLARSYREANAYATPVMLLSFVPMVVSITEPKATPGLLVTPTVNSAIVIRDVLSGHASAGAFVLAFASSCLYAGIMLSLAARLFSTEALVNPAWEPLSLKGLRRGTRRRERRLPAVDEALTLFAVSLLLVLYVSPAWVKRGLLPTVFGNEVLLIAAPTLLFAWAGRYRWVETFQWRRPTAAAMVGAALIGVGVLPWVYGLAELQNRVWPQDSEVARAMARLMLPALHDHPLLTSAAVGALAGICEELLFRGPLQSALTRRLPAWFALGLGAFLFAAAHMDAGGMVWRTLLGLLLGWIVYRGGSIFPAMLLHAAIDSTHLAVLAWAIHAPGLRASTSGFDLAARASAVLTGHWALELAGGALLCTAGLALCLAAWRPRAYKELRA